MPAGCPTCGSINLPGDRFCQDCGATLHGTAAPSHHSSLAAVQRGEEAAAPISVIASPAGTASPVSAAPAAGGTSQEDRRLVTVLFCDLVGYTSLSEKLDVEHIREIQDSYFAAMSREIHHFGGIVEKYAGDAVLAIFGAPIAHEDDPERAIRCAFAMLHGLQPLAAETWTRWGQPLALRIGINTGEVVSGLRTSEGRADYAVTGDVVNTAARFQTAAEPGSILVGLETMQLARRAVLFGPRKDLSLKGKAATVIAYPVLALRDRLAERWEVVERPAPFVGRERELHILSDAWEDTRTGTGQLVSIVGEAGVGKSRLVSAAIEQMNVKGESRILRGRCSSHMVGASLALLSDILRTILRIHDQEPGEELLPRLSALIGSVLRNEDPETQDAAVDVLGEVLGLPAGGSVVSNAEARIRRQVLMRTLHLLVSAAVRDGPAMVILEDVHWIDTGSLDVLLDLLGSIPDKPVMVLATHRPDWRAPWEPSAWVRTVELQPLDAAMVSELARGIVGDRELSTEVETYLAARSGGNPYFVEELLHNLLEAGGVTEQEDRLSLVPSIADRLPATLTEVLLARLDRLNPETRSVAQVGSVIGTRFGVRVLAEVTRRDAGELQQPLDTLEQAALAFPRWTPELEYVFKHSMIQDVAYHMLLKRSREQLHLQTARAIAALYTADEHVEVIAYHYARTDNHEAAAEWLERAGDRAAAVYDNETALRDYEEATKRLDMASAITARRVDLKEKLATVLGRAGQYNRALGVVDSATDLLDRTGTSRGADSAVALAGRLHVLRGTPREGRGRIEQYLTVRPGGQASIGMATLYSALARCCLFSGTYPEGLEAARRAAELARGIGDQRLLGEVEMARGALWLSLGQPSEAREALEGALLPAESAGDLETYARIVMNLSGVYAGMGYLAQSKEFVARAARLYERLGDPGAIGNLYMAEVLIRVGEWPEAWKFVERGAAIVRSLGASVFAADPPLSRGQLYLYEGRWDDARRELEDAVALAGPIGHLDVERRGRWLLGELDLLEGKLQTALMALGSLLTEGSGVKVAALASLGKAHLLLGNVVKAEELVEQALHVAEERHHRLYLVHALRVRAAIAVHQNQWERANRIFDEAITTARSMPDPYGAAKALAEWGAVHALAGNHHVARTKLDMALGEMKRLGARKDVIEIEEQLVTAH